MSLFENTTKVFVTSYNNAQYVSVLDSMGATVVINNSCQMLSKLKPFRAVESTLKRGMPDLPRHSA